MATTEIVLEDVQCRACHSVTECADAVVDTVAEEAWWVCPAPFCGQEYTVPYESVDPDEGRDWARDQEMLP